MAMYTTLRWLAIMVLYCSSTPGNAESEGKVSKQTPFISTQIDGKNSNTGSMMSPTSSDEDNQGCAKNCRDCQYAGRGKCDICNRGYTLYDDDECAACASNCRQCDISGPGSCNRNRCNVGYYLKSKTCYRKNSKTKLEEEMGVVATKANIACPDNCAACTKAARGKCTKCFSGYFLTERLTCKECTANCRRCTSGGPGHCDICQKGYVETDDNECAPCAENCYSCNSPEAGAGKCDVCIEGTVLTQNRTCQDKCGVPDVMPSIYDRVVGGNQSKQNSYPYIVSIHAILEKSQGWKHWCGGSIFRKQWILTAAHCVINKQPDDFRIIFGEHCFTQYEGVETVCEVDRIVMHERYNSTSDEHDIALLHLACTLEYDKAVRPICLPERGTAIGVHCVIAGWGDTKGTGDNNCLNQAKVPIIDSAICNDPDHYKNRIKHGMCCAGYEDGGIDGCVGDSGGPLMCYTMGTWRVAGVVSWGIGCAKARRSGVYTNVTVYREWIETHVNG